jgi:hypothetical protein
MGVVLLDPGIDDEPSAVDVREPDVTDLPGHVRLWRSVVAQAAHDAMASAPSRERDEARRWLTRPTADLDLALSNAGLDPMLVRAWARELAARDWRPLLR